MARKRRFLVVTLDAAGNWPPELVLVRALVQRGHHVRVMSNAAHGPQIAEAGADFRPYEQASLETDPTARRDETPEAEMARALREVFLNPRFAAELLAEVKRDPPDVLLVDQILLMAAAAAESTGIPTAILWHTVFGGVAQGSGRMPVALLDSLNEYREGLWLGRITDITEAARKADAILAFTYEVFDVVPQDQPGQLHYVGPLACLSPPGPYVLPWEPRDQHPLILVSYSTSLQNQLPALQRVADATANLPVKVLFTLGMAIRARELRLASNAVAVPFAPHAAVLPHARLVVTHAGHGTVMAALTAGVPMVCTPMGRDQHAVAACVRLRGLGTVVPLTASSEELSTAIQAALADRPLHERARCFAAKLDLNAGLARAIHVLEDLHSVGRRG